jgi:hypothetical protein
MTTDYTVALFGEAEKGEFQTAYFCENLTQLDEYFGNPPPESRGLFYAVQAILFKRKLIFIRVSEEGFSTHDYMTGIKMLEKQELIPHIDAICTPGVANQEIYNAIKPLCDVHHCILITNESDFYDYLTNSSSTG